MGKIRLTSWRAFWKAAAVLGAFAVWGGGPAYAISEVENFGVSVTVDNAFSLGSQGIEFGSISAVASVTDTAVLTLNGDNGATSVTNGANARIIVITNGEPGTVDVTGAPPNTTMSVGFTNSTITLTHVFDTNAATFTANLVAFGAGYNYVTNAAGDLVFKVGGTLTTEQANKSYTDGSYSGTYEVTVSY